ncbi:MAG: ImmA/IrrE family metallo-endopeptidase [Abitibacteriaceae bacterium]|nr:ImmA/IrrE family metallo-endopeptidase [Abditibacteriaceae bacterium]
MIAVIEEAIANLYYEAGIACPTPEQPLVPLSRLIGSLNLICQELPELTSHRAMQFLLRRGGIVEALHDIDNGPLAGFLYANSIGGSIFVRQEDPVTRRRFSAAHELGHYLLHFPIVLESARRVGREGEAQLVEVLPPVLEADAAEVSSGRILITQEDTLTVANPPPDGSGIAAADTFLPPIAQMEREADVFAAHLLMPEDIVRSLVSSYRSRFNDVDLTWRLSTELFVSRAAMRWRLCHLGLLQSETALWN